MDVTCERCGTEYEFDETLVSDRGTTVKCTNCGHLFKVYRQGGGPRDETGRTWQLRTVAGETKYFGSLKELQRLIAEGRVTSEDAIMRRGEGWKKLSDIAELQGFFAASPAEPRRPKSTMLGVGDSRAPRPPAPPPPSDELEVSEEPTLARTTSNRPPPPPRSAPPRAVPPPPRSVVPSPPPPPSHAASHPAGSITVEPDLRAPRPARSEGGGPRLPVADAATAPAPRRNFTPAIVGLAGLVVTGAVGAWWVSSNVTGPATTPPTTAPTTSTTSTPPPTPAATAPIAAEPPPVQSGFLADGDRALARDQLVTAEEQYRLAVAAAAQAPAPRVGLSRAQALRAQELLFEAEDREARADLDDAGRAECSLLRRQAAEAGVQARTHAEAALALAPDDAGARVALADALRLTGDLDGARTRLADAASDTAEARRVALLLESSRGWSTLRAQAEQLVAADPADRSRRLAARAQLAAGDPNAARATLEGAADPVHPELRRLMARIASAASAAPAAVVGAQAVQAPAGDYAALVREGNRLLDRGQVAPARAAFEAALAQRPNAPEATTGLGHALLDDGNAQGALRHFTAAAGSGYAPAYIGIGDASRRLGRSAEAIRAYEQYLTLMPRGPEASIAQSQLRLLQPTGTPATASPGREPASPGPAPTQEPEPAPSQPAAQPPAEAPAPAPSASPVIDSTTVITPDPPARQEPAPSVATVP